MKKNLRQKTNIVVNMGDTMLTLVQTSKVEVKDKRYEEAKDDLLKEAKNYNASVDRWYSDPETYSQAKLWNNFQKLIVSYQRYSTERYALVVNGQPLTTSEESMIGKILDDLTILTKAED